jgi:serine/threonine protein kinase
MAFVLKRLFQALDFLHTECHVAHTDIKEANILLGADDSVLTAFEQEELNKPCSRKELHDGRTIYLTRELDTPKDFGAPVLCDLGSAVPLDDGIEHRADIQPNVYRAPEVILDVPWTYSVDIWNVGCMVSTDCSNEHSLSNTSFFARRSGMLSKANIYSPVMTQNSRRIEAERILLR